ncbi:hypothetical protein DL769_003300 [Monosporascus sp. CRB-8-3]|nr:hypothetical protein DL769_003300 [Monosporascus sp. CRB-8-3]
MESLKTGPVTQLLARIQESTKKYLEFFSTQSLPEPSYEDGDGLHPGQRLPEDVQAARDAALEATDELHHLLLGPLGLVVDCPGEHYFMLSIQYIYRYKIAVHVPLQEETTFADIAVAAGVNEKDVTRFLRVAISRHVFHEPRKGYVVHTAASRLLIDNPMLEAWITNIAEEFWPAVARAVDATQKWPGSEEPNESGYSLAHHTDENPFDVIKRDPARQQRFIDAMSYSHLHSSYSMDHLLDTYDFSGARTIVDVGGSHGQVAVALARKYPMIDEIIVQDLPDTVAGLDAHIPPELRARVRGMEHDFLTAQPVKGADVYLLRWILHDWSDKYCVKILRSLVPGLKKGAKVVVNDICIPEPRQLGIAADRALRLMDISMKAFNNARERDAETWASLFTTADERFKFLGITVPRGARMAVIQSEWSGENQ